MLEVVTKICEGKAIEEDIEFLEELGSMVKDASLCGLGQSAPNSVLSTLRYFRNEYIAHIKEKRCPAGVCKTLIKYSIDSERCKACLLCVKVCPSSAISGEKKQPQIIDRDKCIKCGACREICKFEAVIIT